MGVTGPQKGRHRHDDHAAARSEDQPEHPIDDTETGLFDQGRQQCAQECADEERRQDQADKAAARRTEGCDR